MCFVFVSSVVSRARSPCLLSENVQQIAADGIMLGRDEDLQERVYIWFKCLSVGERAQVMCCVTPHCPPPPLPPHTPSNRLMGSHQSQSGPLLQRARSPQLWKTHVNGLLFHSRHICSWGRWGFAASAHLIINPPQNDHERPLAARPRLVRPVGWAGSDCREQLNVFYYSRKKMDEGQRAEVEVCLNEVWMIFLRRGVQVTAANTWIRWLAFTPSKRCTCGGKQTLLLMCYCSCYYYFLNWQTETF